jgi:hypothetical protein
VLFHARKMSFRREPDAIELASVGGARPCGFSYVQLALDACAAWCESPAPYPATDSAAT